MSSELNKEQEKGLQITSSNNLLSKVELEFANKVNDILSLTKNIPFQTNPIVKALMQANAMDKINELITPELMKPVEKLFGSPMGIRTDKVYPPEVMKRIFIEATMKGWGIINNQINVLGGNLYPTKNGYLPRLREIEGLKFVFPFTHKMPQKDEATGSWTVTTPIIWSFNGVNHNDVITHPIRRNDGMAVDAMWGKADTQCLCWLWNKVTGEDTISDAGNFTEIIEIKEEKKEEKKSEHVTGEVWKESEVENMISEEFQKKFDNYISNATGKEDLIKRAKVWCDTPIAKGLGVLYSDPFDSKQINMSKFKEIEDKFK